MNAEMIFLVCILSTWVLPKQFINHQILYSSYIGSSKYMSFLGQSYIKRTINDKRTLSLLIALFNLFIRNRTASIRSKSSVPKRHNVLLRSLLQACFSALNGTRRNSMYVLLLLFHEVHKQDKVIQKLIQRRERERGGGEREGTRRTRGYLTKKSVDDAEVRWSISPAECCFRGSGWVCERREWRLIRWCWWGWDFWRYSPFFWWRDVIVEGWSWREEL